MATHYVDPAASGSNNGTSWTDAWTSLQSAADTAVAGDTVYCRGTQTLTATISFDTNAGTTTNGFIKFIGCNAAGNVDGTRYVLDASSVSNGISRDVDYVWFENIEVHSAGADGWELVSCNYGVFINCIARDNTQNGFDLYYHGSDVYVRCNAHSNGGDGFFNAYASVLLLMCIARDNSGDGFQMPGSRVGNVWGCISHNNGGYGYFVDGTATQALINCIADENDNHGVYQRDCLLFGLIGCRITDNGKGGTGYGIQVDNAAVCGWNFFASNADGPTNATGILDMIPYGATADTNETSGTEGYTDGAADDFNLTESATLRSQAIELP